MGTNAVWFTARSLAAAFSMARKKLTGWDSGNGKVVGALGSLGGFYTGSYPASYVGIGTS